MDNAADHGRRSYFQRRDAKLLKAMNVKHEQARAKLRNERRAEEFRLQSWSERTTKDSSIALGYVRKSAGRPQLE